MSGRQEDVLRGEHAPSKTLALIGLCLGFTLVILDVNILNVALPTIRRAFGGGVDGLQWLVNAYTLVFASLLLSAGALGDRLGTRKIFVSGLLIFGSASFFCCLAPSLPLLIAARALQGFGAALLSPGSLSLIMHMYPDPAERARAVGIWVGVSGIGFAGGPLAGGFLVESLGWRSIFWPNVPMSLLAAFLTLYAVTGPQPCSRRIDFIGQLLAILTLCALTVALTESGSYGWTHPLMLALYCLFGILIVLFILFERSTPGPMLPLALFAVPSFSVAILIGFFYNFGLYGMIFVFTLFIQNILNYPVARAGIAFLPLTLVGALTAPLLSGRLTSHSGPRLPLLLGLISCGLGALLLMLVSPTTPYALIVSGFILLGFGTGMTSPAMTAAVLSSVAPEWSGIASAMLSAARQTGGVLGVALLGTLVSGATFVSSMHLALLIIALGFWLCCACTAITFKSSEMHTIHAIHS